MSSSPAKIAHRPRPDSRSHGRYRRVFPQAAAAQDKGAFLDHIHDKVNVQHLNDLRLAVIREMNEEPWTRLSCSTPRRALEILVGNELAMQLRINLSISFPTMTARCCRSMPTSGRAIRRMKSSCMNPYVNMLGTKTMFILPRDKDAHYQARMGELKLKSARAVPHHRARSALARYSLWQRPAVHAERHARQYRQPGSGDPVVNQLPLQERVLPVSQQELEALGRCWFRPATSIGASYRLPSVA